MFTYPEIISFLISKLPITYESFFIIQIINNMIITLYTFYTSSSYFIFFINFLLWSFICVDILSITKLLKLNISPILDQCLQGINYVVTQYQNLVLKIYSSLKNSKEVNKYLEKIEIKYSYYDSIFLQKKMILLIQQQKH